MAIQKRTERQYYRKLRENYDEEATLLKKRMLLPFEHLLLMYLGGAHLFNRLAGK